MPSCARGSRVPIEHLARNWCDELVGHVVAGPDAVSIRTIERQNCVRSTILRHYERAVVVADLGAKVRRTPHPARLPIIPGTSCNEREGAKRLCVKIRARNEAAIVAAVVRRCRWHARGRNGHRGKHGDEEEGRTRQRLAPAVRGNSVLPCAEPSCSTLESILCAVVQLRHGGNAPARSLHRTLQDLHDSVNGVLTHVCQMSRPRELTGTPPAPGGSPASRSLS